MTSDPTTRESLAAFARAWADHDIDTLLSLMTPDAVYSASVGPEPGTTYRGRTELAEGFGMMFGHDAGAEIEQGEPIFFRGGAVSTWTYRFTTADGGTREERGIDLWRFRDGKIAGKDAYRKITPEQSISG